MKNLLANIKYHRAKNKISQIAIAKKLGIKPVTYNRIENGIFKMTIERLYEISEILKVSVCELLGEATKETEVVKEAEPCGDCELNKKMLAFLMKTVESQDAEIKKLKTEKKEKPEKKETVKSI